MCVQSEEKKASLCIKHSGQCNVMIWNIPGGCIFYRYHGLCITEEVICFPVTLPVAVCVVLGDLKIKLVEFCALTRIAFCNL